MTERARWLTATMVVAALGALAGYWVAKTWPVTPKIEHVERSAT